MRSVVLTGDIIFDNARYACRGLDTIDGPAIVDLTNVRLLGAAGLVEFVRVAKRVGVKTVRLAGARANVRRVLQIVDFDHLFIIE